MRRTVVVMLILIGVAVSTAAQSRSRRVPDGTIVVWVEKHYGSAENLLHTELTINGQTVNIYTSNTWEPVENYLQKGWNTITLDTTLQEPANVENGLRFRIGPVVNDPARGSFTMSPVLWEFRNFNDWQFSGGRYRHGSGPNVRTVKLDFKVYWAGLSDEQRELEAGDFVLVGRSKYGSVDPPLTATIYVNGHALNTFLAPERQVVITRYLKKGKNEIKLVSSRVDRIVGENDIEIYIAGPATWNASRARFMLGPVTEFKAMQGWIRDDVSGRLINSGNPRSDVVERVIPFMIKDTVGPAEE
ncbi:MAG TPA: hypothetical protein VFT12_14105 [Thermoanaerobaculia bacterium]|nr:hypothetical protein [Thermoanaerobaculia bacterium]